MWDPAQRQGVTVQALSPCRRDPEKSRLSPRVAQHVTSGAGLPILILGSSCRPGLPPLCPLYGQPQGQAGPHLVLVDQQLGLTEEQITVFPEPQEAPAVLLDPASLVHHPRPPRLLAPLLHTL